MLENGRPLDLNYRKATERDGEEILSKLTLKIEFTVGSYVYYKYCYTYMCEVSSIGSQGSEPHRFSFFLFLPVLLKMVSGLGKVNSLP